MVAVQLIFAVLVAALAAGGCRRDRGGWYRDATVDPSSAQLKMINQFEHRPLQHESAFHDEPTNTGRIVEHLGPEGPDGRRPRFDFFFADREYRVLYRQKNHELLRGSFGSVYAETRYWYDQRYRGQPTGFTIEGHSKGKGSQSPSLVEPYPPLAAQQIVAMSLVRVVRAHPEFAIFSATYSPDG